MINISASEIYINKYFHGTFTMTMT